MSIKSKIILLFLCSVFIISCQNQNRKNKGVVTEKHSFSDTLNKKKPKVVIHSSIYKFHIRKKDSIITFPGVCCDAYRVFGYESPSLKSKKVILISVFTNEVKGNPFKLKFGSYYHVSDSDSITLKLITIEGPFAKVNFKNHRNDKGVIYFEKEWLEFEVEE